MLEVIAVKFDNGNRIYYFDPRNKKFSLNDFVVVETDKGMQIARVCLENKNMKKENLYLPLKKVVRKADDEDKKQYEENIRDSEKALIKAKKLVDELSLNMKIFEANYTFERNQLVFSFIAEERVDFRELVKKLAFIYKTRIELRQIGVRDKAREIGGIGPCGRFLCCNAFLKEFNAVSINMAKNQSLALNPIKINGLCGRLLCCLAYENEQYNEMKKELPKVGSYINWEKKKVKVTSVDVLSGTYIIEKEDRTHQVIKNKE